MKKILLTSMVCLFVLAQTQGQTLIHYWDFNNFTGTYHNPGIPTLKADYSVIDTNKTGLAYKLVTGTSSTYAGYVDEFTAGVVDSDVYNLRSVNGTVVAAGNTYRFRNPTDSAYLVLYIPSTNYKNLTLTYAVEASSTASGVHTNNFSYSTDSGATWKTAGLDHLSDSTISLNVTPQCIFKLITVKFTTADTTVNNNPKLAFRILPTGNTSLTSGNDRFDNIALDGTPLTNAVANVTAGNKNITLYPNPATNNISINTPAASEKTVMIYNIAGQTVYNTIASAQLINVPVATLKTGMYYVLIHENTTGENYTAKFVKE